MACTPQDLVTAASKFQGIPTGMQTNIATAVACQLAGIPADPQALVEASKCIECGKTEPILMAIAAVCNLGSTLFITLPNDPDAAKFVCGWLNICAVQTGSCTSTNNCPPGTPIPIEASCASFCQINQTTVNTISDLTTQLKAAGLWDLLDVIYPFVGGNAGSCSLNLKDTTKFAITWHGGVTFSAAGVTGDGLTGYGDTGYNPNVSGVNFTLNSAGMGVYINGTNQGVLVGAYSVIAFGSYIWNSAVGVVSKVNTDILGETAPIPYQAPANGNYVVSRTAANLTTQYTAPGLSSTTAAAPTALTAFSLYLLAVNFSAIPTTFASATLKFMWAGAGLSGAQVAALETIITTYETALGRA